IISSSKRWDKGKAPMGAGTHQDSYLAEEERISRLCSGLEGIEAFYLSFKEKRAIIEEARFNIDSFRADFPDINRQYEIWDW
ncbi:hypothetical protein HAX54_014256, partial [Datura stramonium]|nr:hypothetical protein [Datura stramonium]